MKLPAIAIFACIASFSFSACGGHSAEEESNEGTETASSTKFNEEQLAAQQLAWDQVMKIHDEVMPKMGALNQMTKSLKAQWESNENLDDVTKDDISIAIQELESADEGMWDWMHELKQLKPLQDSESHEAILKYLEEQEQTMILVREAMDNSMERGDSLLRALEK
ncbi:MAG: hypothetical protein R2824_10440 [Saprospiraceae bacterium]|nr:hypothetical protein [Lewinella sp.]